MISAGVMRNLRPSIDGAAGIAKPQFTTRVRPEAGSVMALFAAAFAFAFAFALPLRPAEEVSNLQAQAKSRRTVVSIISSFMIRMIPLRQQIAPGHEVSTIPVRGWINVRPSCQPTRRPLSATDSVIVDRGGGP